MNVDSAISFLSHSNWGFLALWLVLLAVAFTACFSEPSPSRERPTNRPRS